MTTCRSASIARHIQRFAPGDPQTLALADRVAVRAVMASDNLPVQMDDVAVGSANDPLPSRKAT